MKKRKLTLDHNNVLQRIYTHSYYTGEARREIGFPEKAVAKLQASNDDKEQLCDHMNTPIGEITRMLSRYFALCRNETEVSETTDEIKNTIFIIDIPQNYPDETVPQLEMMIENYAVMRTLQLWMQQHKPDEAVIATGEIQQIIFNLREMFALRKRPHREKENSFDNLIDL